MTIEVKKFIEQHIDLIDDEQFKELFDIAQDTFTDWESIRDISYILKTIAVDVPQYLSYIPSEYFKDDTTLVSYAVPDCVEHIGDKAFDGCSNLHNITFNNVLGIGVNTFKDCKNLHTLKLPETLEHISTSAFYNSGLTNIIFEGTKSRWRNSVYLDDNWLKGCSARVVQCSDGPIRYYGTK